MNANQISNRQNRISAAAAAVFASALVLSSVLSLFAGAASQPAGASTVVVQHQSGQTHSTRG